MVWQACQEGGLDLITNVGSKVKEMYMATECEKRGWMQMGKEIARSEFIGEKMTTYGDVVYRENNLSHCFNWVKNLMYKLSTGNRQVINILTHKVVVFIHRGPNKFYPQPIPFNL